jgi:hypothetical protein
VEHGERVQQCIVLFALYEIWHEREVDPISLIPPGPTLAADCQPTDRRGLYHKVKLVFQFSIGLSPKAANQTVTIGRLVHD